MPITLVTLDMTKHEKKGMINLVAFDPATGLCVRPMPMRESLCTAKGISLGVPFAAEGMAYGEPPFVEDFFLDDVPTVGKPNPAAMRRGLMRTCKGSLERALGCPVKEHSVVPVDETRLPPASVFTLKADRSRTRLAPDTRPEHPELIRLNFQNDSIWYNLPIMQLIWVRAGMKSRADAIRALHAYMMKQENLFLRIALARPAVDGCWPLEVHGIYGAP